MKAWAQDTILQAIIIVGSTRRNPYRLMRSCTGNSAVKKQISWIVVPWDLVRVIGIKSSEIGRQLAHVHCYSRLSSCSNLQEDCLSKRWRGCHDLAATQRTARRYSHKVRIISLSNIWEMVSNHDTDPAEKEQVCFPNYRSLLLHCPCGSRVKAMEAFVWRMRRNDLREILRYHWL